MKISSTCFTAVALALLALPAAGQTVDVRSYGAACNGTADDAGALQAALDAVPNGGTVTIPCKLGIGSRGVRLLNKQGVTVRGTASGAGVRALATTGQGIPGFGPFTMVVQNCTDCVIRDLEFDGNNKGGAALGVSKCTRTIIDHNYIHDVGQAVGGALSASGNVRNQYINNTVVNTPHNGDNSTRGMWLGNGPSFDLAEQYPIVSGNTIRNSGHTGIATHAVDIVLTNNTVEGTDGAGAKLVPPIGYKAGLVEKNTFRRNFFHGLQLEFCENLTIRDNLIEQNDNAGIYIVQTFKNAVITNNIIRDNNWDPSGGWAGGIWLTVGENIVITDNQFYDSRSGSARTQDNAIVMTAATAGAIRDVQFRNNLCRNHTIHGIAIQTMGSGTMSGITLTGNTCTANAQYGLHLNQRSGNGIQNVYEMGNTLSPNGSGAIFDNTSGRVSDSSAPAVSITAPSPGQTVSGIFNLTANATDNVGVTGVQFRVNGANYGAVDAVAPYTIAWDTRQLGSGSYTITAVATDSAGLQATSAPITVSVSNTAADALAPAISGIAVSSVTQTGATVSFTTSEPATCKVEYGTSASYGSTTAPTYHTGTTHALTLQNLQPGTLYHFRALATDAAANTGAAAGQTFMTATAPAPDPGTPTAATVVVNAYGTATAGVFPIMELSLGTTVLQRWTVTATAHNYTYTSTTVLTGANLRVRFTNDAYDSVSDRNLFVNSLTLNGTVFNNQALNLNGVTACGSKYPSPVALYCNGYFEYPTAAKAAEPPPPVAPPPPPVEPPPPPPVPTGSTVVVNAYGTATAMVFPVMELRQGTTVLQTWTVTATAQNYTYTGPVSGKLRIYFNNDAYDAISDRNLYVRTLTVDGKAYATNAADVYTSSVCATGFMKRIAMYCNGYFEYPTGQ